LLKLFRPIVEEALEANLKRIEESIVSLVVVDDWVLTHSLTITRLFSRASNASTGDIGFQLNFSSNTHNFN